MLVEHFDRQLVLALQGEDVGKLEGSVVHVGQFRRQLKLAMTCIFLSFNEMRATNLRIKEKQLKNRVSTSKYLFS
jgi:hypothetical protein